MHAPKAKGGEVGGEPFPSSFLYRVPSAQTMRHFVQKHNSPSAFAVVLTLRLTNLSTCFFRHSRNDPISKNRAADVSWGKNLQDYRVLFLIFCRRCQQREKESKGSFLLP